MWATRSRVCFLFKSFCLSSLSDSQEWQNEKKSRFKKQFSKVVLPLNWDIAREAGCRQKVGAATDWIYPPRKRKRKNGCKQTSTQHCNALLAPESRIDSTGERERMRETIGRQYRHSGAVENRLSVGCDQCHYCSEERLRPAPLWLAQSLLHCSTFSPFRRRQVSPFLSLCWLKLGEYLSLVGECETRKPKWSKGSSSSHQGGSLLYCLLCGTRAGRWLVVQHTMMLLQRTKRNCALFYANQQRADFSFPLGRWWWWWW